MHQCRQSIQGKCLEVHQVLLSEDNQTTSLSTPINRKAAEKHINKSLDETIDQFGLDVAANKIIKEGEAILDAADKVSNNISNDIDKIVLKEARRFFTNELSSEAAAKNMAAGVMLYYKEQ